MIAFLKYAGKTLILELSPLPGKPGYFDASVVTLTGSKTAAPVKTKRRRVRATSQERLDQIGRLREHLKKMTEDATVTSVPAYSTALKMFPHLSGGSIHSILRLGAKNRFWRYDQRAKPATLNPL
jgi:hypothetical protein